MKNLKRETIVVKYGSSSVANDQGMDQERLDRYAADLSDIRRRYDLVVVSSGSVAVGKCLWRQSGRDIEKISERALAMLGSGRAFVAWQDALAKQGVLAGQLPITHREMDDSKEGPSLIEAIEDNLNHNIVTVANENDALSDIELAKLCYGGDNDGLAAHIGVKVGISAICLMTDMEGLIADGNVLRKVDANEAAWEQAKSYVKETVDSESSNNMLSKIKAAIHAAKFGIDGYIAWAEADLQSVMAGQIGTHFVARDING